MVATIGAKVDIDTEDLVGKNYMELNIELFSKVVALPEYMNALNGKMPQVGTWAYLETAIAHYRLWILPIILYDGISGIMVQVETWTFPDCRELNETIAGYYL